MRYFSKKTLLKENKFILNFFFLILYITAHIFSKQIDKINQTGCIGTQK